MNEGDAVTQEQDEFSAAFAEQEVAQETEDQSTDTVQDEEPVQPEQAEDEVAVAPDEPKPEGEEVQDDPNSQTWEQRYKTLQGKYNAEINRLKAEIAQLSTPEKDEPKEDAKDEEEDYERMLEEDYPTLSKGIERKAERVAREIAERIRQELRPVVEVTQETLAQRHFKAIRDAHGDFDEIVSSGALRAWVDDQPSFVKDRYELVMERGDARSVIELLNAFKRSRAVPQKPKHTQPGDDIVVRTRSAPAIPAGQPDTNDFSAGFNL